MLKSFDHYPLKVLHLESTDICQASCPLCLRETDMFFDKNARNSLTVNDIKSLIDESIIKNLNKMFMCGTYGDPAANKLSIEIYEYFRHVNPEITLGMNTNGALQNTVWWQQLGHIMNRPQDYVVFSIDGLEDTNYIYRRGVNWKKLTENAEAYISTGASAHWDMLIYEHNEHQIDACRQLAKDMGFTWFRAKVSKRKHNISWLKPPKSYTSVAEIKTDQIKCSSTQEQSIYISADKRLFPCCWLANDAQYPLAKYAEIASTWGTNTCVPKCKKNCGIVEYQTNNFENQFRIEEQLR